MSTSIVQFPDVLPRQIDTGPLHRRSIRRRWRLASLVGAVLLPTLAAGAFLYGFAADQYVTEFRFSVRHEAPLRMDGTGSAAMTASLGSGAASPLAVITDSQIVIQYLKSRQVIDDIVAAGVDLDAIYARNDTDILAHLSPGGPVEERQRYWKRMVDPFFDMTTGNLLATGFTKHIFCGRDLRPRKLPEKYWPLFGIVVARGRSDL